LNQYTTRALLEAAGAAPRCGDPLRPYRWLVGAAPGAGEYLAHVLGSPSGDLVCAEAADGAGGSALILGRLAPFESRILGPSIARLSDIVAWGPGKDGDALHRALHRAREMLGARGARHLIAAAMADEVEIQGALTGQGFHEIARKRSFFCSPENRGAVRPITLRHVVRPANDDDIPLLRGFAERFEYSQYRHIPGVTHEAVTRLYEAWIERACRREFASDVLVVEQAGRAAGFFAFKIDDTLLALTGKRLLRYGLTAVHSGQPALFSDLILGLQRYVMEGGGDGVQFDFYAQNSPVERMFERFCCFPAAEVIVYMGDALGAEPAAGRAP
jgi:hypothetical protein